MTQRVVLVKPPERSRFNFGTFSLGVLAAAIRDLAEVSIVDATHLPVEEAAAAILSARPDVVGITAMGVDSVPPAAGLLRRLRFADGGERVTILAGGHGASGLPAELLAAGADAAVLGEGERTLRQILRHGIRPGEPGMACRVDGRVVTGARQRLIFPLDRLSSPARDLMPPPPDGIHLMETSRGCPHDCAFCETTRFFQRRWRAFSDARVAAEVRSLVEDYDAWIIHFADDNFTANPRRAVRLCRALESGPLPAFFIAFARGDDLAANPDLLPAMAAARVLRLTVGVESLSHETASQMGKPIGPETYRRVFERMRELGMFSVASLIVGLPGEDPTIRERSVELAVEVAPDAAHFVPFRPLPGTPLKARDGHHGADIADVRDACAFTEAFFQHPVVRARLEDAVERDGIQALLARGALEHHPSLGPAAGGGSRRRADRAQRN